MTSGLSLKNKPAPQWTVLSSVSSNHIKHSISQNSYQEHQAYNTAASDEQGLPWYKCPSASKHFALKAQLKTKGRKINKN